ncbi:UDP-N-acetylglucosamine 2-epimerase [Cryomorphaceae bacterium 1068]|nr:UDP-N-acetylglucosamine 2-epimerase [Cryomorphaceae bacterium 1068]
MTNNKRKICVVTGTRAEYGLLYWLMKYLNDAPDVHFQLVVTGMHLSAEFGLTYQQIEKDGFRIDKKVEILLSSDSTIGISKSMGLAMISMSEAFQELQPNLVVVLGDRFEMFACASVAMICRIPIAHIHGGEATEGLIDEPIRHSITKMSQLHFTATDAYRKRVIQLGEHPNRVFNFGSPGIDNVFKLPLLTKAELEASLNFNLDHPTALLTFHPVTLEIGTSAVQFEQLLQALDTFKDLKIIFTNPNSDTDGRVIIKMIDDYVRRNPEKACSFISLGQLRYLSALKYVSFVIGNSSSGLIEVPSFGIPTIDIGDRQKGRIRAESVIHCEPLLEDLIQSIKKASSSEFKEVANRAINPYGGAGASSKIADALKSVDLTDILKKSFHDL